jgi:hypothetical protein
VSGRRPAGRGNPFARPGRRPGESGTWDTSTSPPRDTRCPTAGHSSTTSRSGGGGCEGRADRAERRGEDHPAPDDRRRHRPAARHHRHGRRARCDAAVHRPDRRRDPARRPGVQPGPAQGPRGGAAPGRGGGGHPRPRRRRAGATAVRRGHRRVRRGRRVRGGGALRHSRRRGGRPAVGRRPAPAGADPLRRPAEAVRTRGAAARPGRGAAARRAGQLPRRARQAVAGGEAARDRQERALRVARPGAARRDGGQGRGGRGRVGLDPPGRLRLVARGAGGPPRPAGRAPQALGRGAREAAPAGVHVQAEGGVQRRDGLAPAGGRTGCASSRRPGRPRYPRRRPTSGSGSPAGGPGNAP